MIKFYYSIADSDLKYKEIFPISITFSYKFEPILYAYIPAEEKYSNFAISSIVIDTLRYTGETYKKWYELVWSLRRSLSIDPVVETVREDLLQRSKLGHAKYGTGLDRRDLNLCDWLNHAYEETLDQANYLKRAIIELELELRKEVVPHE